MWRKHPWRGEERPCGTPMRRRQLNPVSTWTRPGHLRVQVEAPNIWSNLNLWTKVDNSAVESYFSCTFETLRLLGRFHSHRKILFCWPHSVCVFYRTTRQSVRTWEKSVQSGKRNSYPGFKTAGAANSVEQSPQRPGRTRPRRGQGQPGAEPSHRPTPTAGGQGITPFVRYCELNSYCKWKTTKLSLWIVSILQLSRRWNKSAKSWAARDTMLKAASKRWSRNSRTKRGTARRSNMIVLLQSPIS